MESKKNPSADLTKKSGYFFSIGLLVSTSLIVTAFEWRTTDPFIDIFPKRVFDDINTSIIVPATEILPPAPPIKNVVLEIVNDNVLQDSLPPMDMEPPSTIPPLTLLAPPLEPEIDIDLPVLIAEESAIPKGGLLTFYEFVGKSIKYPAQARRMGVEGRVFVEFVINRDGSLSEVKAIKGIGAGCDEEAVRIIQSAPAWNPAKQRGKTVRQRYTLPIIFKLG